MGGKAKRKREAKSAGQEARAKAAMPAGVNVATEHLMCFCGGSRHPYGSKPVQIGPEMDAVRLADGAQIKHRFTASGRTHGCPLRDGFPP